MNKLLTLLFLIHNLVADAQELSHILYTVRDGLPGSNVYQCLQDRSGFMWFCTNQGVSRFDGKTFRNFSKEDGLPDNEILKLYLDAYGNVWFISLKGVPSVYYKGNIQCLDSCKNVYAITEDFSKKSILLLTSELAHGGTALGYYQSPNTPGHWDFTMHSLVNPGSGIPTEYSLLRASAPDGTGFYFSMINPGLHRLIIRSRGGGNSTFLFYAIPFLAYLPYDLKSYFSLTPDRHSIVFYTDTVYVADSSHLKSLFALKDIALVRGDCTDIYFESPNVLWICSRNRGLIRVEGLRDKRKTIRTYFPGTYCTSIRKDREGGYWVTTHDDGVFYLPCLDAHYLTGKGTSEGKDVRCIQAMGDTALIAGLSNGSILMVGRNLSPEKTFPRWASANKNNRVLDIKPYGTDSFLVASDHGIHILSASGACRKLDTTVSAKGICCLKDSGFVFASAEGLCVNAHWIFNFRATCIGCIGNDYYWGTMKGMYSHSGSVTRYWGDLTPTLGGIINHINLDPDTTVWVSTQQGLVILRKNRAFTIGKDQGLLSDLCKHVLIKGNVAWVSTDKGISRITFRWEQDGAVFRVNNITEDDGLISNDVNQTAFLDGYIWAATSRGISNFPVQYIPHSMGDPLININEPTSDSVRIDYANHALHISLSGISFRSGKQITYRYRLKDLDTGWIATNNPFLEFSALPFGNHTFEVRVVDRWGIAGPAKRLSILYPPPFWEMGWFIAGTYLLTALAIGAGVYTQVKRRHRKRDRDLRLKTRMADLEMMALRSQMNPHFIFNCLSSIQYYILGADIKHANLYLHKLSSLIRKVLQHCSRTYTTLNEELSILGLYMELEKLRLSDRMDYTIEVDRNLLPSKIMIPSLIIQPFVENSILHGISPLQDKKGMVRVDFKRLGKYLVCTVEDNGIGINASRLGKVPVEHDPLGISNIEHRIHIINAMRKEEISLKITDKSETALKEQGTIAEIHFLL
jgi:ligand-binding sensor domain-containing protein